jgi:hypothetical protein
MTRRLLNLLTLASLILCGAVAALWVRSGFCRENLWSCGAAGGRLWWVESAGGRLAVRTASGWPAASPLRRTSAPAGADVGALVLAGERPAVMIWHNMQRSLGVSVEEWRSDRAGLMLRRGTTVTSTGGAGGLAALSFSRPMRYLELVAPHWMLVLLSAVPSTAWLAAKTPALRRHLLAARGRCQACGYDLTGNVSGVCPECGQSATGASA